MNKITLDDTFKNQLSEPYEIMDSTDSDGLKHLVKAFWSINKPPQLQRKSIKRHW